MNAEVKKSFLVKGNDFSDIKKIIGVVSGKGGVGKSTVTCALARQLKKMGYKTGILDADITGPSIPRMMGVEERCEESGMGIMPPESADGIKIMSMNLLLQNEDDILYVAKSEYNVDDNQGKVVESKPLSSYTDSFKRTAYRISVASC